MLNNEETYQILCNILQKFRVARSLLVDGKVIPADKKFQGINDNLIKLIELLEPEKSEDHTD